MPGNINRGVGKWDRVGKAANKGALSINYQWAIRAQSHRGTLGANVEHAAVLPLPPNPCQMEKGIGMFMHLLLSVIDWGPRRNGGRVFWSLASTNRTTFMLWRKLSGKEMWILATEHTEVVSPEQWGEYMSSQQWSEYMPLRKETLPYPWLPYLSWLECKEYGLWVLIQASLWDSVYCLSIWVYLVFYHD